MSAALSRGRQNKGQIEGSHANGITLITTITTSTIALPDNSIQTPHTAYRELGGGGGAGGRIGGRSERIRIEEKVEERIRY